ncbi:MAG: hypothetical protein ABSG64_07565 [Solirubrobacteraceae bacterium]|jgi:hypothetical protein
MQPREHVGEHHAQTVEPSLLAPGRAASPHPSTQPGAPDLERQITALAAQVRRLGERLDGDAPTAAADPEASALTDAIIATAEAAAAQIRASAEREAERIRNSGTGVASERMAGLVTMLVRQRGTLATLAAQADRIGQAAASLGAEARALDSELRDTLAAIAPGGSLAG